MSDDQARLAALKKGLSASSDQGNVAIRVADLRWLLELARRQVPTTTGASDEGKPK